MKSFDRDVSTASRSSRLLPMMVRWNSRSRSRIFQKRSGFTMSRRFMSSK